MIEFESLLIEQNINLAGFTTMRLGGNARYFTRCNSIEQIRSAINSAHQNSLPIFILGGGSNLIVRDAGFNGLVIKNEILGVEKIFEDEESVIFSVGAGENWDKLCRQIIEKENLSGCESMVMIPGTVGALAVQNVGAYGQETVDIFEGLEAVNLETGEIETFSREACRLGYRSSIFREEKAGKYFITTVRLKFNKHFTPPENLYISVEEYFKHKNIPRQNLTPNDIMRAVIYLRSEKLPDPSDIPSAGSFFKNVELSREEAEKFKIKHHDAPIFYEQNKCKIPTGWLIDRAGLRGKTLHGMRPHDKNALILTNISARSYSDLDLARAEIRQAVQDKFGFEIDQEPLEL